MICEAVDCEYQFAEDLLGPGGAGNVGGRHPPLSGVRGPTSASPSSVCPSSSGPRTRSRSWNSKTCRSLTNFFERTVASYQVGVEGDVAFDEDF